MSGDGRWLPAVPDPMAMLEGLFAHSPVAYQIYDRNGRSLAVNQAFLELFGSAPPPEYDVRKDDIAEATGQLHKLRRAFEGETVVTDPVWYDPRELKSVRIREGRRCAMVCSAFPLFDGKGEIAYVVFIFKDVTAELEAREQAEAERDLLRAIIQQSGDGVVVADASCQVTIFNRVAEEQHGLSGLGQDARRFIEATHAFTLDGQPSPVEEHPLMRALTTSQVASARWWVRRSDGETRALSGTAAPLTRPDGKPGGAILITRDETERLRLDEKVREGQAQLRAMLEHGPAAIYMKDLEGRHLLISYAVERKMGFPRGFALGRTVRELFGADRARVMEAHDAEVLATRGPVTGEEDVTEPDGVHTYLSVKFPVLDDSGKPIAIAGMSTDITDRKLALEKLRQSEQRLATYFEASPFPASLWRSDGTLVEANAAFARFVGVARDELVGSNGAALVGMVSEDDRRRLREDLAQRRRVRDQEMIVNLGGQRRHILFSLEQLTIDGDPHVLLFCHDVTEHVRLEEELRQSQKMEAVGRLAGGVAHDFNNLLTALSGYDSLLLEGLKKDDPLRRYAERIGQAAQRASSLTNQLLAFSRKQPVQLVDLDVNDVVGATVDMLRRLIGEDVSLETQLEPGLGLVHADRAQLEQVLLNLAVNARDAMPRGGRITIATANIIVPDGAPAGDVPPGSWVRLSVRDTGIGIAPEQRARLFEPFYTTKEPGKGTGLGLATVYGIVARASGRVRVDSQPGHGATFEVWLPRVAARTRPEKRSPEGRDPLPRGGETLLLIEDDAAVRDFVGFVLRQQGYHVLEAEDGPSAIELAAKHGGPIALLISDVVMPHMNGYDVAEQLKARRPALKVLHISGYPGDAPVLEGRAGGAAFLAKPFSREALLTRVRMLLDEEQRTAT